MRWAVSDAAREALMLGKPRRKLDRWIMDTLGRDRCGNNGPPRDNQSIYIHDDGVWRVFSMQNDGFQVGIGYPDEWHVIMHTEAARLFAWWTFKVWVTDWFGLRTHLWYAALHRRVSGKWKWHPYQHPKRVWRSNYDAWLASHSPKENSQLGRP